jgi:pimeloyl-ACP methyl ester carboxylesterase
MLAKSIVPLPAKLCGWEGVSSDVNFLSDHQCNAAQLIAGKFYLQDKNVKLAWEIHGPAEMPVIALVHGLGVPLCGWPAELIERLAARGYRILTFDNRDIGRSQLMSRTGVPNLAIQWLRTCLGMTVHAPYQLDDMMHDTVALFDELGIGSAHVVGVSMGGMIAQLLAIHAGDRVKSLTSIMSTTGDRSLPGPDRTVRRHIMSRPRSDDARDRMEHGIRTWELIGSRKWRRSPEEIETFLQSLYDRGVTADGVLRQMAAIMAAPSRRESLAKLTLPALVIHGAADPLVPVACGYDTAQSIKGAALSVFEDMGHDLPDALVADIATLIADHVERAENLLR